MNLNIKELCEDPLFQLNLAIWLTQSQPLDYFYINPLFFKSGCWSIYSISPLLALPPDIRSEVAGRIACQDGARPDLVLESKGLKKYCMLECKVSSFGSKSSTAEQARTLLLIAGPIFSEVLGMGKRRENKAFLCYFSNSNQIKMLNDTLDSLTDEIEKSNLEPGGYDCFGIKTEDSAILLEYSEQIKIFFDLKDDSPVEIIKLAEETDPRPLYIIPYDPNTDQTKEEQKFCRRVLFERILSYLISDIGDETIPTTIFFTTEKLLSSATFGVYEVWEDSNATKHLRKLVKNFLINIRNNLTGTLKECINYEPQKGLIVNLKDRKTQEELLKQLQKFKPESLDLSKEIQPSLFDESNND